MSQQEFLFTNQETGFTLDYRLGNQEMLSLVDNNTIKSWGLPTPTDSQKWTVTKEGLIKNNQGKALTFEPPNRITLQPVTGNSDDGTQKWSVDTKGVLKCKYNGYALVGKDEKWTDSWYDTVVCELIDETNLKPNQRWNIPPEAANILNEWVTPSSPPPPPPPPPPAPLPAGTLSGVATQSAHPNSWFGYSVDIDGNRAIVGAPAADIYGPNSGAAYILDYQNGTWQETKKIAVGDKGDLFGSAVAISGNVAVVGAMGRQGQVGYGVTHTQYAGPSHYQQLGTKQQDGVGQVCVFVEEDGVWRQVSTIPAPEPMILSYFGRSVAVDGDSIWIGSHLNGTVCVYKINRNSQGRVEKITLDSKFTPPNTTDPRGTLFGASVAVSGNIALVSSIRTAQVYVYSRPNANSAWQCNGIALSPSDFPAYDTRTSNYLAFGFSMAIDGDTALIGTLSLTHNEVIMGGLRLYTPSNMMTGSVYIVKIVNGQGHIEGKLEPNDIDGQLNDGDGYGYSVSLKGDLAMVGAARKNAAYLFKRENGVWRQIGKTMKAPQNAQSYFGASVAVKDSGSLVGVPTQTNYEGAVYSVS